MLNSSTKLRIFHLVILICAGICLVIGLNRNRHATGSSRVDHAIRAAADYLVNACDSSGKFKYRVNMNPKVNVKPKYNLLRHAGTMYSLGMHERVYPDPKIRAALARSALFFRKSLGPIPGEPDMLGVWSRPELTGKMRPDQVKLGGNGLGLVALAGVQRTIPGAVPMDEPRKMGRFIIYMQKPDGDFYSKYIPSTGGRDAGWRSLYYPGEAALGMAMLYEMDHNPAWLEAGAKAIAFLARQRTGKSRVEADHWALLATEKLLPLHDEFQMPVSRKIIIDHAVQICESMLAGRANHPAGRPEHGCFSKDGRTCPTATRLEGLLAAMRFLPESHGELKTRMLPVIRQGIRFLMRAQVRGGKYAGGIPRAIGLLPKGHRLLKKSFNSRVTEVRIDYVQHALSAFIGYRELLTVGSQQSAVGSRQSEDWRLKAGG